MPYPCGMKDSISGLQHRRGRRRELMPAMTTNLTGPRNGPYLKPGDNFFLTDTGLTKWEVPADGVYEVVLVGAGGLGGGRFSAGNGAGGGSGYIFGIEVRLYAGQRIDIGIGVMSFTSDPGTKTIFGRFEANAGERGGNSLVSDGGCGGNGGRGGQGGGNFYGGDGAPGDGGLSDTTNPYYSYLSGAGATGGSAARGSGGAGGGGYRKGNFGRGGNGGTDINSGGTPALDGCIDITYLHQ